MKLGDLDGRVRLFRFIISVNSAMHWVKPQINTLYFAALKEFHFAYIP